jgi:hypothetical protein
MTNIYEAYLDLNQKHLEAIRNMFFSEFGVAEPTLQNFLQGVTQPKNKYVKFFSILFDLKENLSPIVNSCPLSKEYRPFEYKQYQKEAKVLANKLFSEKKKIAKKIEVAPKTLRQQARENQRAANELRRKQRTEESAKRAAQKY